MRTLEINGKEYNVTVASTEDEKEKGLMNVSEMPENEGMLFVYDEPQTLGFWMKDTKLPLDIIFIDEFGEVVAVEKGEPMSEAIMKHDNVMYVLELNQNSGVEVGDDVEGIEEDEEYEEDEEEENKSPMLVLDDNGNVQMELEGGERIFSRIHTKTLARLAKKAYKSKSDKDYKALGKKVFAFIEKQNTQEPEYV